LEEVFFLSCIPQSLQDDPTWAKGKRFNSLLENTLEAFIKGKNIELVFKVWRQNKVRFLIYSKRYILLLNGE
jgi:hypothetical protein